jgi:hypothetical protein
MTSLSRDLDGLQGVDGRFWNRIALEIQVKTLGQSVE